MKEIILKKEDGVVTKGFREVVSNTPYMLENENFFKEDLNQVNIETCNPEKIVFLGKQVNKILDEISVHNNDDIIDLYDAIKVIKTKNDFKKFSKLFLDKYSKTFEGKNDLYIFGFFKTNKIIEKAKKDIEDNFDLVLSVLIKQTIKKYYLNKLIKLDKKEIDRLEQLRVRNIPIRYMYQEIGESFDENKMNDGVVKLSTKILLSTIDELYDRKQSHLCWQNCRNATPFGCMKVDDIPKRKIDIYDFIENGYQIINEDGIIDTFVVTKCSNYEKEKEKKLTKEQLRHLEKVKENIFMLYFDAETVDEAVKTRNYLIKTKQILINQKEK